MSEILQTFLDTLGLLGAVTDHGGAPGLDMAVDGNGTPEGNGTPLAGNTIESERNGQSRGLGYDILERIPE